MPIFEFSCSDCQTRFELLFRSSGSQQVRCPACSSGEVRKMFSAFAFTGRETLRRSGCSGCTATRGCSSCSSGRGGRS